MPIGKACSFADIKIRAYKYKTTIIDFKYANK